jgi:hypothetical protein
MGLLLLAALLVSPHTARAGELKGETVAVSADGRAFVLQPSGDPFVPWGFNYDHERGGRLLEDYWETEWEGIAEDFREMKALGANVARVHLQFGKFMRGPHEPNERALRRLGKLLDLAKDVGLRLDVTGLGCYEKAAVPAWYDELSEQQRWEAQAAFWDAVARRCARSPAVFCYDLMNEPVVAGAPRAAGDWLGPPFGGDGKCYVQFITLDATGRVPHEVAKAWIRVLTEAIRRHDRRHLVTVGLVEWSLDRPGLRSGFVPDKVVADLDFVNVHPYPKRGEVAQALDTLRGFAVGKPVVIEETFPLWCTMPEFEAFMEGSRGVASGWIGFYWGKTPEELRASGTIADALMLGWLDVFERGNPAGG